jgi:hypothetical protein
MSSKDRVTSFLATRYLQTDMALTKSAMPTPNESQMHNFINYRDLRIGHGMDASNPILPIITSIQVGLQRAYNNERNTVDLEDALVIARCGEETWNKIRKKSGSLEYKDYRTHLPKSDKEFIEHWLSNINY